MGKSKHKHRTNHSGQRAQKRNRHTRSESPVPGNLRVIHSAEPASSPGQVDPPTAPDQSKPRLRSVVVRTEREASPPRREKDAPEALTGREKEQSGKEPAFHWGHDHDQELPASRHKIHHQHASGAAARIHQSSYRVERPGSSPEGGYGHGRGAQYKPTETAPVQHSRKEPWDKDPYKQKGIYRQQEDYQKEPRYGQRDNTYRSGSRYERAGGTEWVRERGGQQRWAARFGRGVSPDRSPRDGGMREAVAERERELQQRYSRSGSPSTGAGNGRSGQVAYRQQQREYGRDDSGRQHSGGKLRDAYRGDSGRGTQGSFQRLGQLSAAHLPADEAPQKHARERKRTPPRHRSDPSPPDRYTSGSGAWRDRSEQSSEKAPSSRSYETFPAAPRPRSPPPDRCRPDRDASDERRLPAASRDLRKPEAGRGRESTRSFQRIEPPRHVEKPSEENWQAPVVEAPRPRFGVKTLEQIHAEKAEREWNAAAGTADSPDAAVDSSMDGVSDADKGWHAHKRKHEDGRDSPQPAAAASGALPDADADLEDWLSVGGRSRPTKGLERRIVTVTRGGQSIRVNFDVNIPAEAVRAARDRAERRAAAAAAAIPATADAAGAPGAGGAAEGSALATHHPKPMHPELDAIAPMEEELLPDAKTEDKLDPGKTAAPRSTKCALGTLGDDGPHEAPGDDGVLGEADTKGAAPETSLDEQGVRGVKLGLDGSLLGSSPPVIFSMTADSTMVQATPQGLSQERVAGAQPRVVGSEAGSAPIPGRVLRSASLAAGGVQGSGGAVGSRGAPKGQEKLPQSTTQGAKRRQPQGEGPDAGQSDLPAPKRRRAPKS